MTAEELENSIVDKAAPLILDVRSGIEYRSGHIPGAIHAPLTSVQSTIEQLAVGKKDFLVLVCEHGPRAQMAKFFLKINGYNNVKLLKGHMMSWRSAGRPMQVLS